MSKTDRPTYTFDELLPYLDLSDLPRAANKTHKFMNFKASSDLHKDGFLIHAELVQNIEAFGLEEGDFYLVRDCISYPHLGLMFYRDTDGQLIGELTRVKDMEILGPVTAHREGSRTRYVIATSPEAMHIDDGSWLKIIALIHALMTA